MCNTYIYAIDIYMCVYIHSVYTQTHTYIIYIYTFFYTLYKRMLQLIIIVLQLSYISLCVIYVLYKKII